jgi:3',5'-cyclic AMP phosphodiesterase CpdA
MRVLHFSDIHLPEPYRSVPLWDWFGKRAFGGVNLLFGRWRHFADAPVKLAELDRFRQEEDVDLVVFTGDYTALGTTRELHAARQAVEPFMQRRLGYVHVPGNHDIYTWDAVRKRHFLEIFGDTLATDLPEYCVQGGPWPVVRLVSDDVAVVAVNSAHPNPLPWRSSGRIPTAELQALRRIIDDERVTCRFVFVITHHAPRRHDGNPDHWYHGLANADDFLSICAGVPRGAILSGHVHRRYVVRVDGVRPPLFCAGSTTQAGAEGLWVFDVEGKAVRAMPGRWAEDRYVLDRDSAVDVSEIV